MAILKYKNSKGEYVEIPSYTFQSPTPVQTTGDSVMDVMSQNAVTTELSKKANSRDVYTISEINNKSFLTESYASTSDPKVAGSADAGTSVNYARADHIHPAQTTITGNAGTATKLQTARKINNTSFDGSIDITTSKWGTSRNIKLTGAVTGNINVDGSTNVELTTTLSNLDASKITSGTIDIERLPKGALERLVIVANQAARFALTANDIQEGDTVKQEDTGKMYFVVNSSRLNSEEGYSAYTASAATSVAWSGITGKPTTFSPSDHTQASNTITSLTGYTKGSASALLTSDTLNTALGKLEAGIDNSIRFDVTQSLTDSQKQTVRNNIGAVSQSWVTSQNYLTSSDDLPVATSSQIGGIKLGYSTNNKNYAIQIDSNGNAYVNVPWYSSSGSTSGPTYDIADTYTAGLVKPYSVISTPTINSISSTTGKYYHVQMNSTGNMFVNVPWTDDNTTYSIATTSTAGLVKPSSVITKPSLNSITNTSDRYYSVQMSSDGNMFVNVPWVSGSDTLPTASSSTLGGVKIGSNISVSSGTISLSKTNITNALGFTPASADDIPTIPTTLPNQYPLILNGVSYNGSTTIYMDVLPVLTEETLNSTTVEAGCSYGNTVNRTITTLSGFGAENPNSIIISTVPLTFTAPNAIKMYGMDTLSGEYYIYCLSYTIIGKIAINCAVYNA